MNGRVFDPEIARFLSADPLIQAPGLLQSYNRYSYTLNNPLKYTDPSGYSWISKKWKKLRKSAVRLYKTFRHSPRQAIRDLYQSALAERRRLFRHKDFQRLMRFAPLLCGPAAPACAATVAGANAVATADAYGASPGDALRYGAKAAAGAYITAVAMGGNRGGNAYGGNWIETSIIVGTAGGISSSIQGHSFRRGFERSALYALAGEAYKDMLKRGINAGEVQSETAPVHPTEIPFATQSPGNTMKTLSISDWRTAQFGLSSSLSDALTSMSETALQWIPKNVPFAHPISVHHDLWNGLLIQKYGEQAFTYSNVPTMFGSAALTVASFGNTVDIDGYSSYERR